MEIINWGDILRENKGFSMPPIRNINVLGVKISGINLESGWRRILGAVQSGEKGYVCVEGVHGVVEAQENGAFREVLNRSILSTPDGVPMVWMGRLAGCREIARVYGPDLMAKVCSEGRQYGLRHFFYGGKEGVAELLKAKLESRFSGLEVVGTYTPPFRPLNADEQKELEGLVSEAKPDVIWVGISTPKQELFMAENIDRLDTRLMFGVGATFDFHAGLLKQAPAWMQAMGLEWLFRLCAEPKRLWRRYFTIVPKFLVAASAQVLGLRRYPFPESYSSTNYSSTNTQAV
jgi:N-acetylglucosaminyldiphosphoundecaprenol N-acetyl-beta-D-mannosaminyltransferase